MVIGDMPPWALGLAWPRGPFCMPLRTSSKPICHSCWATPAQRNERATIVMVARRRRCSAGPRWLDDNVTDRRLRACGHQEADMLWILFVGLVAGILARLISPGPNKPGGFILTIVLGIAGAFLATFIGQTIGWYHADQGAGFIGATVGAVLVLFIWNRLVARGAISDSGVGPPPA